MTTKKPWLAHYEPFVPEHIDYPRITLSQALEETARKNPDHVAIIYKGTEITYKEYLDAVQRFANALKGLGVKKGDRVAVHLPNCPQFMISYAAVLWIGAIAVPCNPIYTAREMEHQLNDAGSEVIVTLSLMYPMIKQIRAKTKLRHVVVAQVKTYLPPILRLLFTLVREKKTGHAVDISGDENTHWFTELLKSSAPDPKPTDVDLGDTAVLMYTGGTTGISKGAQLTHKNIYANARQVLTWVNGMEAKNRVFTTLPLYHSYAMTCCMNSGAVAPGTAILVPDPRDMDDVLKSIQKYKPDLYPGVPALYVAINNHPDVHKYDLKSIKACVSGAAPLPVEVQEKFQEITGARLVEGYGLSEATPVTHANPVWGDSHLGTIGLPYPDTESKIMDIETGKIEMGVGEVGELCVRGPQVMKGYWNMPTETANQLRPDPEGGDPWLYTGDIATMDADGYFKIVDRKKDMILGAGGFNVYPREIEDVLYEHPKVKEAAVAGIYIPEKGERIKAYVVLKDGESATEEEILEFCKANLAPYKIPKVIEFKDTLPKTLVGKILRRVLVEEETKSKTEG